MHGATFLLKQVQKTGSVSDVSRAGNAFPYCLRFFWVRKNAAGGSQRNMQMSQAHNARSESCDGRRMRQSLPHATARHTKSVVQAGGKKTACGDSIM